MKIHSPGEMVIKNKLIKLKRPRCEIMPELPTIYEIHHCKLDLVAVNH